MKYIKLFLILLLIPFIALAEDTCNQDDIKIESIVLDSTNGNIEETSNPNTDNNQVNLGLKMNVIDDSITYKLVITNTSNQDYTFDKNSLSTDYINYDITYEDNTKVVKAGESKVIFLTVNYSNKPSVDKLSNGVLIDNPKVTFNLQKEEAQTVIEEVVRKIVNPETKDVIGIFLLILIISLIITIILLRRSKKVKYITLLILAILLTSNVVKALCTCTLDINTSLEIDAKDAVFLPGTDFINKIKLLAGTDTSNSSHPYATKDTKIKAIKYSEIEPNDNNKQEENIVSTTDSEYPIYMWFDNGTIYWWSEDTSPSTNEDPSYMFCRLAELSDISGLENFDVTRSKIFLYFFAFDKLENVDFLSKWNTSHATSFRAMFYATASLINVDGLSNWDTSNVTQLPGMFTGCTNLVNIDGLKDWDISNVENLNQMFWKNTNLPSLKALSNWDTSKVVAVSGLFAQNQALTSLEGLENWDVSNVTDMNGSFSQVTNLVDIEALRNWNPKSAKLIFGLFESTSITSTDPIKNWNISNVEEMWSLFSDDGYLEEVDLSNWNTSNVTDMSFVFNGCNNLKVLKLDGWDTSKVTNMSYMFNSLNALEEIDISSFDTSKVTTFKRMFNNSTALKHIYVGEKWNIDANTDETKYVFPSNSSLPNFSNTNPNYRDLSYAHTGEGGYLELKTND